MSVIVPDGFPPCAGLGPGSQGCAPGAGHRPGPRSFLRTAGIRSSKQRRRHRPHHCRAPRRPNGSVRTRASKLPARRPHFPPACARCLYALASLHNLHPPARWAPGGAGPDTAGCAAETPTQSWWLRRAGGRGRGPGVSRGRRLWAWAAVLLQARCPRLRRSGRCTRASRPASPAGQSTCARMCTALHTHPLAPGLRAPPAPHPAAPVAPGAHGCPWPAPRGSPAAPWAPLPARCGSGSAASRSRAPCGPAGRPGGTREASGRAGRASAARWRCEASWGAGCFGPALRQLEMWAISRPPSMRQGLWASSQTWRPRYPPWFHRSHRSSPASSPLRAASSGSR